MDDISFAKSVGGVCDVYLRWCTARAVTPPTQCRECALRAVEQGLWVVGEGGRGGKTMLLVFCEGGKTFFSTQHTFIRERLALLRSPRDGVPSAAYRHFAWDGGLTSAAAWSGRRLHPPTSPHLPHPHPTPTPHRHGRPCGTTFSSTPPPHTHK
jgi:hypothetical protein